MYIEIDDEIYNSLEDDFKQKLKVFQPEDTSKLKNKANELLADIHAKKSALANKDAEIATLQAQLKNIDLERNNNPTKVEEMKQLFESMKGKYESLESEHVSLKNKLVADRKNNEAMRIAQSLTRDVGRAKLLAKEISTRLDVNGEEIIVLDAKGNRTVDSIGELTSHMTKEYPFLVDGSQSSGGGASGNNGDTGSSKIMSRQAFGALDDVAKVAFMKSGGKLTEE